jgi:hypothetical protein
MPHRREPVVRTAKLSAQHKKMLAQALKRPGVATAVSVYEAAAGRTPRATPAPPPHAVRYATGGNS